MALTRAICWWLWVLSRVVTKVVKVCKARCVLSFCWLEHHKTSSDSYQVLKLQKNKNSLRWASVHNCVIIFWTKISTNAITATSTNICSVDALDFSRTCHWKGEKQTNKQKKKQHIKSATSYELLCTMRDESTNNQRTEDTFESFNQCI